MDPNNYRLVGTFTILSAYGQCPHRMYRQYIAKDLGPFVQTEAMKWGNDVHEAFEKRVGSRGPLPVGMQQWERFCMPFDAHTAETEIKLGITQAGQPIDFWDKQVWFRGKVDLAIVQGETGYINDWKTGSGKYEDPFELEVGAVLLQASRPRLRRILGHYTWLKEDRVGKMYDLSDTRKTLERMRQAMDAIAHRRSMERWDKIKSGLCGWCPVKDCEHWYEAKP